MLHFTGFLVTVAVASAFEMPQLYGKFSMMGTPGVDSFFSIPRTNEEAEKLNWTVPEETKNNTLFKTYCEQGNPNICILTDNKGSIAGLQISIPRSVDTLNITRYNYTDKGFKSLTLNGGEYYSNQLWFVSQGVLHQGGRNFDGQTGHGLWLQTKDVLNNIPTTEEGMSTTPFRKQNCFIRMGQHYFWDARKDLSQEEFMPWFTLYDKQQNLVGCGFIAFGSKAVDPKAIEKWMEDVPAAAIKAIAPDVPEWVYDFIKDYGIMTFHMYFNEEPYKMMC